MRTRELMKKARMGRTKEGSLVRMRIGRMDNDFQVPPSYTIVYPKPRTLGKRIVLCSFFLPPNLMDGDVSLDIFSL